MRRSLVFSMKFNLAIGLSFKPFQDNYNFILKKNEYRKKRIFQKSFKKLQNTIFTCLKLSYTALNENKKELCWNMVKKLDRKSLLRLLESLSTHKIKVINSRKVISKKIAHNRNYGLTRQ
jgi:hypothetical protein